MGNEHGLRGARRAGEARRARAPARDPAAHDPALRSVPRSDHAFRVLPEGGGRRDRGGDRRGGRLDRFQRRRAQVTPAIRRGRDQEGARSGARRRGDQDKRRPRRRDPDPHRPGASRPDQPSDRAALAADRRRERQSLGRPARGRHAAIPRPHPEPVPVDRRDRRYHRLDEGREAGLSARHRDGAARLQGARRDHPPQRARGGRDRDLQGRGRQHRRGRPRDREEAQARAGDPPPRYRPRQGLRPVDLHHAGGERGHIERRYRRHPRHHHPLFLPAEFLGDGHHLVLDSRLRHRDVQHDARRESHSQHHVARRHRARNRNARRQLDRRARKHRPTPPAGEGRGERGSGRRRRGLPRRGRVDAHDRRRLPAARVRQGNLGAALQGPGAHGHLLAPRLSRGRPHPHSDARFPSAVLRRRDRAGAGSGGDAREEADDSRGAREG